MKTRETLRRFIADTFFVDDFADGDSFLKTGIVDSTGMMELILFLETEFDIRVEDRELVPDNLDSIDNLLRFIRRKTTTTVTAVAAAVGTG
jgi:acyl carrier protein